jgi:hypothetical protein
MEKKQTNARFRCYGYEIFGSNYSIHSDVNKQTRRDTRKKSPGLSGLLSRKKTINWWRRHPHDGCALPFIFGKNNRRATATIALHTFLGLSNETRHVVP